MKEKRRRSFLKAITWRVIATLTTMGLVFFLTGEWTLTIGVGILDIVLKLFFYYWHERTWNRVEWARNKKL